MSNDFSNQPNTYVGPLLELVEEINKCGKDWADKSHAATLLEETKTAVRSEIANRIRRTNPHMTRRDAEVEALVSDDYRSHIVAMADARRDANLARVHYENAKAKFDAMRTAEVSRRAELTRYQT